MKGKAVVYTVPGCPHCRKAKTILQGLNVDFVDVSVEKFPRIVQWLRKDVGVTRIPQVYFNAVHIGGIEKLEELVKDERKLREARKALEEDVPAKYLPLLPTKEEEDNVVRKDAGDDADLEAICSIDPSHIALRKLSRSGIFKEIRPRWFALFKVRCASGVDMLTEILKFEAARRGKARLPSIQRVVPTRNGPSQTVQRRVSSEPSKKAENSEKKSSDPAEKKERKKYFSGHTIVTNLRNYLVTANEERAMAIADSLLRQGQVVRINASSAESEEKFDATENALYQLVEDVTDNVLNGGYSSPCSSVSPNELSEEIRNQILELYSLHLSPDGKFVDYKSLIASEEFSRYKDLIKKLRALDLSQLSEQERKAFFINVYNALVIHATAIKGPPSNDFQRWKFFRTSSYLVNGSVLNLEDIEHGILRGNRKGVGMLSVPFGQNDVRRKFSLSQFDPRIHFALNCGAKSCPPIKTFTAENLDEELEMASESYLDGPDAFELKRGKKEIAISMLFKWFSLDFGRTKTDVLKWMHAHVRNKERQAELGEAINNKFSVSYLPYDWDLNGSFG